MSFPKFATVAELSVCPEFLEKWSELMELLYGAYPEQVQMLLLEHGLNLIPLVVALQTNNSMQRGAEKRVLLTRLTALRKILWKWPKAKGTVTRLMNRVRKAQSMEDVAPLLEILQEDGRNLIAAQVLGYQRNPRFERTMLGRWVVQAAD